jgi:glycosyltransferase involved in cell wall biosynthesis
MALERPLRIAFLTYRGNPHSGGQGVYARYLTRALVDLGHSVEVFSGQPYPELDARVPLTRLPSFDLYNADDPLRLPHPRRLRSLGDWVEIAQFATLAFPEPLAFSVRVAQALKRRAGQFDLAHDNQCLGYGLLELERRGLPVIATIHHPITVDLRLELARAETLRRRFLWRRWYAFTKMQRRVARRLDRIVTDSATSLEEIHKDLELPRERMHVVPVGVDPDVFRPRPEVSPVRGRIVTAASADSAMKGLTYLLEAVASLRGRHAVELVVVGRLRENGPTARRISELGLDGSVRFVSGISEEDLVELYCGAEVAVVPSLFEGFSLPAVEAMACGTPLVATTGGALGEVVGRDGDTALLVPPGDAAALAGCLARALEQRDLRATVGRRGREWVLARWTWRQTALGTAAQYRALLADRSRRSAARPPPSA